MILGLIEPLLAYIGLGLIPILLIIIIIILLLRK